MVSSEQWEVGGISGKLCFCSLLQWQPRYSGLPQCGRVVGIEKGELKSGSEGDRFRVGVNVNVRNR